MTAQLIMLGGIYPMRILMSRAYLFVPVQVFNSTVFNQFRLSSYFVHTYLLHVLLFKKAFQIVGPAYHEPFVLSF